MYEPSHNNRFQIETEKIANIEVNQINEDQEM